MIQNMTRRTPLTPEELEARQKWYDEQMVESARVNAASMLAQQQIQQAEFQSRLIEATGLTESTLLAIREWLRHNHYQDLPRKSAANNVYPLIPWTQDTRMRFQN
jgi:hypothetical protein